jgi:hypothetical protein
MGSFIILQLAVWSGFVPHHTKLLEPVPLIVGGLLTLLVAEGITNVLDINSFV